MKQLFSFRCLRCEKETSFGLGRVSLMCQGCGSCDIVFGSNILISPANYGDVPEPTLVKKDEPFLSRIKEGCIWEVFPPKEDPLPPPLPPLVKRGK